MDCGPTCLKIIAKYYGKAISIQKLRNISYISREGVSFYGISLAAEKIGFTSLAAKIDFNRISDVPLPCIIHWSKNHFTVLYKIKVKLNLFIYVSSIFKFKYKSRKDSSYLKFYISDPAYGLISYSEKEFIKKWTINKYSLEKSYIHEGAVLFLEPQTKFYELTESKIPNAKKGFRLLATYIFQYKKYFFQLIIALLVITSAGLITPFLTQSLVDIGVNQKNLNFVYLILLAQIFLLISTNAVDFLRGWLLLHLGTRINISIVSDFLSKLMRLPISFFDTKIMGDLLQRIADYQRVERFLTGSTLNVFFSLINIASFSLVLLIYNSKIFAVFVFLTFLSLIWVSLFLKKRSELDYKRFSELSENQNMLVQIISGMHEIKLNGSEDYKRKKWQTIQAKIFKLSIKSLSINQYQQSGSVLFNSLKNILISFFAAREVINGNITLGMMLSITYIIGQLNSPIEQIISFLQIAQDTKISLDRIGDIQDQKEEESESENLSSEIPKKVEFILKNVSFKYDETDSDYVLKNLNLNIPNGKITAIVGTSGSGKTTLLKLLLKFYKPSAGDIYLNENNLNLYSAKSWRTKCGVVMQDGYIFNDNITNNITMSDLDIDEIKLAKSVQVANIAEFIKTLPLGFETKLGSNGNGISAGQKQRILISRAVYKDPDIIFFDEASSALDAKNESIIMKNLNLFFKEKTVLIVAHRLSTVRHADQIIVLEKGEIIEVGDHNELTEKKGAYFNLVKNQLELGN